MSRSCSDHVAGLRFWVPHDVTPESVDRSVDAACVDVAASADGDATATATAPSTAAAATVNDACLIAGALIKFW